MSFTIERSAPALAPLLLLAAFACGGGEPDNPPLGTPAAPPVRSGDGLLGNPELQALVDLQVQRDGASLMGFLEDPNPAVRARAAYALASVQDPGAAPALVTALTDPDPGVRRDAAFALGQLAEARYGPTLLGVLGEETNPEVRRRILEAVGKVGDARLLDRLLGMEISEEEEAVRNLAVSRMGVRGETLPTGIQYLVRELTAADPLARTNAGYYFGRNPSPGPWAPRADQVRSVLDSLPPDDPLAMHLLLGLGTLGDPQDNPRLVWWLRNAPDWRIRANAARALNGRAADPRVREKLMDALEEPTTHVAYYAAEALSGSRELGPSEREALKSWVADHPEEWRRVGPILSLLGRFGEGAFILEWLKGWSEEDVLPRTRGLGALAFVPGAEAMGTLTSALGDDSPRIRTTALGGLARRWRVERDDPGKREDYFRAFATALGSGDVASTSIAAPALADSLFLPLGSLDLLLDAYAGASTRNDLDALRTLLGSLGETGSSMAEGTLERAARSPEPEVREAAERALATLRGEEPPEVDSFRPAEKTVDWSALAALGPKPRLILETEKGRVVLVLDAESAPLTVQTIAGFAEAGRYTEVPFHRVVPNFVVQGGDFARRDGYGGPGFNIRSEFTQTPYLRGVVGMASSGKDTEGSQFFLTHSMQPHLDGGYTVFGWVESGMDIVDSIYEEDLLLSARVEPDIQ